MTGATTRVSTGTGGTEGDGDSHEASFSPDGTSILFASDSDNLVPISGFPFAPGVYLKDLATDTTIRLSHAPDGTPEDFGSAEPSFSPDGKSIVFDSGSDNLVAGDINFAFDVFIVTPATTIQTFIEQSSAVTVASHLDGQRCRQRQSGGRHRHYLVGLPDRRHAGLREPERHHRQL